MRVEELVSIANDFLQKNYRLTFNIPIKRNNRLRSSHGRFVMKNNQAQRLELAGYLLDYGARDAIIGVLKHECIHYALFEKGMDYRDGSPVFEAELKKHHAPKTRTQKIGKYYLLKCRTCEKVISTRKKRVCDRPDQYRTSCCGATFMMVGERIFDGAEG
jgi:SprT-like protein